jgi:hypothetical protein
MIALTERKAKGFLANYAYPIVIAVLLLAILPAMLSPYMGIFGTYTTYAVTALVLGVSMWLSNRTKKYVEKV